MKKKLTLLLIAILFMATAHAQLKPPTLPETTRDTLYPEIVVYLGFGEFMHYQHPCHPENGAVCVVWGTLRTLEPYSQYLWEADEEFLPMGGNLTDPSLYVEFHTSGYLKVTVWDSIGNSGTDSIWFNIKDWIEPMPDFTMELDSTNHAVFSGTATSDHHVFEYFRSLDTLSWTGFGHHYLQPGHWTIRDDDVYFTDDSIWNYKLILGDSCGFAYEQEMTPGMMMSTQPSPGGGWYLTFHTVLQSSKTSDYVYPIFTIDQDGVRHQLYDDSGEPVILPASSNSLLLKKHPDAYYQGAVAKLSSKKDDGYEVLSYSNQVVNPLPDTDEIPEAISTSLEIYPNPSKGKFTVQGTGNLTIINMLGQTVLQQEIDGKSSIELPAGIYIAKLSPPDKRAPRSIAGWGFAPFIQKVIVK